MGVQGLQQEKWNVMCFAATSIPKGDGPYKEFIFLIKGMEYGSVYVCVIDNGK